MIFKIKLTFPKDDLYFPSDFVYLRHTAVWVRVM